MITASITVHEALAFCPELARLVEKNVAEGRTGKEFKGLAALSTTNNLLTIRQLMLHLRPKQTMEIGLAFGGSALVFTTSHRDNAQQPCRQHLAIDPFQSSVWDEAGIVAIERAGLRAFLDFRESRSALELARLLEAKSEFGLIYVDGSHLFEDVFVDFYFIAQLVSDGGMVLFDDSTDPNIRKVLGFIRSNLESSFEEVDLRQYRPSTEAGPRYLLARMLDRTQLTAFRRIGPAKRSWNAPFRNF